MSDAIYFNQIKQLVELQKVDDAIFTIRRNMERTPRELEELQQHFENSGEQRRRILDKLEHLQEQQKRLALEIEDGTTRIKKSKNKIMQVGNTREYHAMMREMDSMERINRSREEEKTTLLEELEAQNNALAKLDSNHSSLQAELKVKRDGLAERLEKARAELDELDKKRVQDSRDIPQPIFRRYEFIRSRLEHPVIVAVTEGVCSGCNIAVPPQTYIEIQRGQQILSCPSCQRLIFWNEHFAETPVAEMKAAKSKTVTE